jgi:hypothetical protein
MRCAIIKSHIALLYYHPPISPLRYTMQVAATAMVVGHSGQFHCYKVSLLFYGP